MSEFQPKNCEVMQPLSYYRLFNEAVDQRI